MILNIQYFAIINLKAVISITQKKNLAACRSSTLSTLFSHYFFSIRSEKDSGSCTELNIKTLLYILMYNLSANLNTYML